MSTTDNLIALMVREKENNKIAMQPCPALQRNHEGPCYMQNEKNS